VDRRWVGGSCPNIACMPSKNEIASAKVAHLARDGGPYGTVTGSVTVDMATVRRRKREMVERQITQHLQIYRSSGAELIMGSGRFLAPKTVEAKTNDGETRVLLADKVFLNVGTHAAIPNVPGLEAAQPLTHVEALELDYLPQHLIVIGGGYAGLEFAQAYRRFGSDITVIESGPQLMAREDIDVSREMRRILRDEAIEVLVEAELLQVLGRSGDKVTLTVRTPSSEQRIDGSDILVAAGRIPNTAGIGLEDAGVELDGRGYIRVNGRLETSAPDVWALGECAGSPQFTHISEDDFRIIRDNLAGGNRSTHDRLVPYCMFTDPPLARVGLSEGEAERQGVIVRVAKLPMNSVLGAQATDQREGFMKALVGDGDDRILGFTMIGATAGEVMAVVHTAMLAGLSYSRLADADFAHPTMAEGLSSLFSSATARDATDRVEGGLAIIGNPDQSSGGGRGSAPFPISVRRLVGERVQQPYGDEMLVALALSKRVGRLGVAIIVEPPLHDVAEVAGSGTATRGLKPAPPASVTSSGSAPSLNADPVIAPGLGGGAGLLNPGAIVGVDGLQVPASADVPNGAIADVPVVVPGKPPTLVSVVGFAIPVIGHVVMLPRAPPGGGIRLPKLG
jgi:pyruvate/2-oxoglutarate dehydrogenase complex dihydrolipoamide dehydrogenase (E3) component